METQKLIDITDRLENAAARLQGVADTLGLIGQEAQSYSHHIGSSAFLMQEISRNTTEELYKIWNELRGG